MNSFSLPYENYMRHVAEDDSQSLKVLLSLLLSCIKYPFGHL